MKRYPSRRVAAGLGAMALAAGATAAVAAFSSAPAANAATTSVTTVSETGTTAAHGDNERCELALPGSVLGSPKLAAGATSGVRIWHDGTGWHLRATHPGTAAVAFSGVVVSGQPITEHPYRLEPQDSVSLSPDHRTMTFRFVNHGAIDGIDFTDGCADHTGFSLWRAGTRLPTGDVFLGEHGAHPGTDPFTVHRDTH
jgi:hypothetical protein